MTDWKNSSSKKSWIEKFRNFQISDFKNFRFQKFQISKIFKIFRFRKISKFSDFRFQKFQISKFSDFGIFENFQEPNFFENFKISFSKSIDHFVCFFPVYTPGGAPSPRRAGSSSVEDLSRCGRTSDNFQFNNRRPNWILSWL